MKVFPSSFQPVTTTDLARRAFLGTSALEPWLDRALESAGSTKCRRGALNCSGRQHAGLQAPVAATAKRVIMIFAAGGLSQQDLFDEKPLLNKRRGEELP